MPWAFPLNEKTAERYKNDGNPGILAYSSKGRPDYPDCSIDVFYDPANDRHPARVKVYGESHGITRKELQKLSKDLLEKAGFIDGDAQPQPIWF